MPPVTTCAWSATRSTRPEIVAELAGVVDRAVEEVLVVRVEARPRALAPPRRARRRTGRRSPDWQITRVAAVQSWPALKKPPARIPSTADSRSASSKTITGALPPSSRWATLRSGRGGRGDRDPRPRRAGDRDHPRHRVGGQPGAGVAVAADEVDHARAGRPPAPCAPSQTDDAGVVSEGLRTTVLPAASAGAIFQIAIIAG